MIKTFRAQLDEIAEYELQRNKIVGTNQSAESKAGFVFEEMQKTEFNLDALSKGTTLKAYTDRSPDSPIPRNDPVKDIQIVDTCDATSFLNIQAKAKTPLNTYTSFCRPNKNQRLPYTDAQLFLCTSDGFAYVKGRLKKKIGKETFRAENGNARPIALRNYNECIAKLTDHICFGIVKTEPLSLDSVQAEVLEPWFAKTCRQNIVHEITAESIDRNCRIASLYTLFDHATISAIGNTLGDGTEAFVGFGRANYSTGLIASAAVNSTLQATYDIYSGLQKKESKTEIALKAGISLASGIANAYAPDAKWKALTAVAGLLGHKLLDAYYRKSA